MYFCFKKYSFQFVVIFFNFHLWIQNITSKGVSLFDALSPIMCIKDHCNNVFNKSWYSKKNCIEGKPV